MTFGPEIRPWEGLCPEIYHFYSGGAYYGTESYWYH